MSKILVIVCVALSLLLSGCGRSVVNFKKTKGSDKSKSDERIKGIIVAIEQQDSEKLIAMFSAKSKNDAKNLKEQVKSFCESFDDKNLSFEDNAGPVVYEDIEKGEKIKKLVNWYTVMGAKGNYTFFIVEYTEDTLDKANVGLYTLRVIKECDFENQFIEHDKMEIPGLFYAPTSQ